MKTALILTAALALGVSAHARGGGGGHGGHGSHGAIGHGGAPVRGVAAIHSTSSCTPDRSNMVAGCPTRAMPASAAKMASPEGGAHRGYDPEGG